VRGDRVRDSLSIVFYVSGHGFGHAVRCAEVLRAILAREPGARIHVRTSAPAWLFPAADRLRVSEASLDVGVVQAHSLTLDPEATLRAMAAILDGAEALVDAEVGFLREVRARVVVGDIPPPAFEAARRAGVPGIAIANFSWDWIYRAYLPAEPRFGPLIDTMASMYAAATLLLRLPFHGDLSVFPVIRDIPLIARRSARGREGARRDLGLGEGPVALLTFGGLGLAPLPVADIARALPAWTFLVPWAPEGGVPGNLRVLAGRTIRHEDLVAAADVVVTKPGYGIVAECLANDARVLYTSRGDFPEYPILEAAVRRHARARYVPPVDLLAGRIGKALDDVLAVDDPVERLADSAFEGAATAAEAILGRAGA
jgi:UDP:flavonoid glycosyltransferase YjiC (YdhE family)